MDYNPNNPLPLQEQRAIEKYFSVETQSMATDGYSEIQNLIDLRRKAVHLIVKHSKSKKFDAFIPYLALHYFDRYVSRHPLPTVLTSVNDDVTLLAIGCLSIAWKMRSKSFSLTDFLRERSLRINRMHILRVELMILHGLNWRMRAVTAICFVGYLFNLIKEGQGFKRRTINEIIIQAQGDITFTQFKPSVIAASALLAASLSLYHDQFDNYKNAILNDRHVDENEVKKCLDVMIDMCKQKNIAMKPAEPSHKGKEIMEDTSETKKEASIPHKGKETSEIQEEPESTQGPQLDFNLKWVTNENEDVILYSPRFHPVVPTELAGNEDVILDFPRNHPVVPAEPAVNEDVILDPPLNQPVVPAEPAENEDADTEMAVAPKGNKCLSKCCCC